MTIVDSHCHASPSWYEPVESLLFQMDRNGVDKALLIQMYGQTNNEYLTQCVRRYPDRFGSVVLLDTASTDAPQRLEELVEQGASGLRLRNTMRSPGDDPLAVWRKAAELGVPVSCGGPSEVFASDEFIQLVQSLPAVSIVIEHLGSTNRPDGEQPPHPLRRKVFTLARFPNVFIKVHGLGEIALRTTPITEPFPFEQPVPPLLEMVYQSFGAHRMMWGSDFPVVSSREGYHNALRLVQEHLYAKSENERRAIFGGTAISVFKP